MNADNRAAAEMAAKEMERSMLVQLTRPSSVPTAAAAEQRPPLWSRTTASANEEANGAHLVHLKPNVVAPGKYANRLPFNWESAAFETLKEDIRTTHGNLQPVKVRKTSGTDVAPYEIVCGHRRHRACFELDLPVLCIVEDMSDADLVIQMTKDNASRHDCSFYERGVQFKRVRDEEVFPSNEELGAAVGLDQSEVARLIRLAGLPSQVIDAFKSPADIRVKWESKLSKALKENRQGMLNRAAAISISGAPTNPKQVLALLCDLPDPAMPAAAGKAIQIKREGNQWATIFVPAAADGAGCSVQFALGAVAVPALEAALRALLARG